MSSEMLVAEPRPEAKPPDAPRKFRRSSSYTSLTAHGEPFVWLTGGALAIALVMITGLLLTVLYQGIGTFWPVPVVQVKLYDGAVLAGEVNKRDSYVPDEGMLKTLEEKNSQVAAAAREEAAAADGFIQRRMIRIGNFEITKNHFAWVDEFAIAEETTPEWMVVMERMEWGRFYGVPHQFMITTPLKEGETVASFAAEEGKTLEAVLDDGSTKPAADVTASDKVGSVREIWTGPAPVWEQYGKHHDEVRQRWTQVAALKKHGLGQVSHTKEQARLEIIEARLDHGEESQEYAEAEAAFQEVEQWEKVESARINGEIRALSDENDRYRIVMAPAVGEPQRFALADIVRAYPANQLGFGDKVGLYLSRWGEFLGDDPRAANSEGGVFPAIWGTVVMTLLMSLLVVPFGVLAALYLREYAKAGLIVSAVRIAINNLAGVPSIVFGAFGLGFFCYRVGHFIDVGPENSMPVGSWWLLAALLTVTSLAAFFIAVSTGSQEKEHDKPLLKLARRSAWALWLVSFILAALLLIGTPYFDGFFRAKYFGENQAPTFGTGGLMWASLTLALLTLPVVIVATEEALAAVPNSMREGSYACGASKWQTIRRIVLPRAMPGIMTGMILAMARGAGEVAPLMMVGVLKMAPALPVDTTFPFVHPERSFMHLGYHIFDVAFQSPNSEAAKPMVYTTTLLLIGIIAFLNIAAISLRTRLRRRFVSNQF